MRHNSAGGGASTPHPARASVVARYNANVLVRYYGMAQDWRTPNVDALFDAILRLETPDETAAFFRDLCTLGELHDMGQRWAVVRMLDQGLH
jgi:hypothetical protein